MTIATQRPLATPDGMSARTSKQRLLPLDERFVGNRATGSPCPRAASGNHRMLGALVAPVVWLLAALLLMAQRASEAFIDFSMRTTKAR